MSSSSSSVVRSSAGGAFAALKNKKKKVISVGGALADVVCTPFSELLVDGDFVVRALICRTWDATNPSGNYLGTEYVASDDKGNALHLIARSSIAHCVVPKLQVGEVYIIRRFTVAENKKTYRLRHDDDYLIQLESNSSITKVDCHDFGFVRQPFVLLAIEDIVYNDYKYLIDVVGRVVDLGVCKPTRNGSQFIEFSLLNERGGCIKVTLWGSLATELIKKNTRHTLSSTCFIILLPALNVREYKGVLQLSSTSGTQIFDSDDIPEVAALRQLMGTNPVGPLENHGTLLQILEISRQQYGVSGAGSTTMMCGALIDRICPRTPWNYNSCGEKGCKKGLKPVGTQFWCESCEKICQFPILRYRLRLEISDSTTSFTVTMFDEVVEGIMKKPAAVLMSELDDKDDEAEFPEAIQQLVGTHQIFEIKSHTYYNHGQFESFTVSRVVEPPAEDTSMGVAAAAGNGVASGVRGTAGATNNEDHGGAHDSNIAPTTESGPNPLKRKLTIEDEEDD